MKNEQIAALFGQLTGWENEHATCDLLRTYGWKSENEWTEFVGKCF
jgi:hypothetical protein